MTVNWLAVIVAAVASWAVGAVWYMVLSRQWLAAIGKTRDQIDPKDFSPYIFSIVVQLVMAIVLSMVIVPLFGSRTVITGLQAGGLMWLGFVITSMIQAHRYEGAPWSRTIIDGGYLLAVLLVQGIVLGIFG